MSTVFNVIGIIFMVAVVAVLLRGLINLLKGGSGTTSNKLMQARVVLQFFALCFILIAAYLARGS
jgi:FlaG/FlaF family flagellin (archaellin)